MASQEANGGVMYLSAPAVPAHVRDILQAGSVGQHFCLAGCVGVESKVMGVRQVGVDGGGACVLGLASKGRCRGGLGTVAISSHASEPPQQCVCHSREMCLPQTVHR